MSKVSSLDLSFLKSYTVDITPEEYAEYNHKIECKFTAITTSEWEDMQFASRQEAYSRLKTLKKEEKDGTTPTKLAEPVSDKKVLEFVINYIVDGKETDVDLAKNNAIIRKAVIASFLKSVRGY